MRKLLAIGLSAVLALGSASAISAAEAVLLDVGPDVSVSEVLIVPSKMSAPADLAVVVRDAPASHILQAHHSESYQIEALPLEVDQFIVVPDPALSGGDGHDV